MTVKILFVFRQFDADVNPISNDVEFYCSDKGSARDRAGNLAKRNGGPCNVAYAAAGPLSEQSWDDRYISTALPSEYHARGYRFERMLWPASSETVSRAMCRSGASYPSMTFGELACPA